MEEEEVRWRRSKGVFGIRFLFAAWNIGFAFGAARFVQFKLASIETEWRYEMLRRLRWQRVSSDV